MRPSRLHVLAIGGAHQYLHFLPIVFELVRRGTTRIEIFVLSQAQRAAVEAFAADLGYEVPPITVMYLPMALKHFLPAERAKSLTLLYWAHRLRDAEALFCAERTSTLLKRLPGRCPTFIHSRHGFGDRAVGFEERIALFDHVLVAGSKDRERLLEEGRVAPERCHMVGPVKLAAIARAEHGRARLFPDERPVVLYNPHDNKDFSSFDAMADKLIVGILADGRYNLVVAPHIKLAKSWSASRRAEWIARSVEGRVIVDLGSPRVLDMTYALAADCYFGDVSSQVYEFLARPRPCLFCDAHGADWRDDPSYAMWRFGPVIGPQDDPVAAIDRAIATHADYLAMQQSRLAQTLADNPLAGDTPPAHPDDIDRAADLLAVLTARPGGTFEAARAA